MSMKYLGETLDIHSGGIDHIPVHHTNEIAQSQAATGKPFANYWMHTNHITIEGEKISKSLGNGITLEDIEAKGFSLQDFRLHVLESHYRSQSKFSWDSLEAGHNRLRNLLQASDLQFQTRDVEPWLTQETTLTEIKQLLLDDLNTPMVLSLLSGFATRAEERLIAHEEQTVFAGILRELEALLGIQLANRQDISEQQKRIIADRDAARGAKDWAASDKLRDQLQEQGIAVRDTQHGTIWSRL